MIVRFDPATLSFSEKGTVGEWKVRAYNPDTKTILASRKGYAENPGSRYSGLKSYYPTEHVVIQLRDLHQFVNGTSENVYDATVLLSKEGRL